MIENFGSYLKNERELRGVPLEEISGTTKIHIRFLQALEDNKFDELPGEVFIKGYIRSYANTIGSDVDEMLNIYEKSVGESSESVPSPEPKRKISALKFLGIALTILLLPVLILLIKFLILDENISTPIKGISSSVPIKASKKATASNSKNEQDSLNAEQKENSPQEVSNSEEALEVKKETDTLVSKPKTQNQENSSDLKEKKALENLEKPLKLTIKVKNNSWFNLTIDDLREEDFILAAGEKKIYQGNEVFRLTIGNKNGTDIVLNGKNLILPESKENVVKDFVISSKLIE